MEDPRKKNMREHVLWFENIQAEFLNDNKGCKNVLDYINQIYRGDKDYWAKIARRAGVRCHKRNGEYYIIT